MIASTLIGLGERIGFLPAYSFLRRTVTGSQTAIVFYHRILPSGDVSIPSNSLSPEVFERQIKFLKENFNIISLDMLSCLLRTSGKLPKKTAVITFDDGYKDIFTYAYPIMKKYNVPATIFLSTGCINRNALFWWDNVRYCVRNSPTDRIVLRGKGTFLLNSKSDRIRAERSIVDIIKDMEYNEKEAILEELISETDTSRLCEFGKNLVLSWAEIREMAINGMNFGAHTVNHPILTKVPIEICRREIVESKRDIEAVLGVPVTSFSYPDGAHNNEIVEIVKESGFTCATTTSPYGLVGRGDNVFTLRRIPAYDDFYVFEGLLSGIAGDFGFLYGK